jgi:hypothetical protein
MAPVSSLLTFVCDNKASCHTPDVVDSPGQPNGWARLAVDYVDPGGVAHHWNITLCPPDAVKFPPTYPSVQFP